MFSWWRPPSLHSRGGRTSRSRFWRTLSLTARRLRMHLRQRVRALVDEIRELTQGSFEPFDLKRPVVSQEPGGNDRALNIQDSKVHA